MHHSRKNTKGLPGCFRQAFRMVQLGS